MKHQHAAITEHPPLSSPEATAVAEMPFPEVFKRFGGDVAALASAEVALVRVELSKQVPKIGQSVGLFGVAAVFGLGAFLALTATLIAAIALVLPVWAAALIVTVVYLIGAALMAMRGRANLKGVTAPIPHAMENLRADFETVKAGFGRGR